MTDAKTSPSGWLTTRRFLLLLAAALFVAFPRVTLGLRTFFYRDFGALGYPCSIFTRDSLLHGELPLWNPYSHCGVPWLAQMGQWYPPAWVCLLLPLPWAQNFFMLAHLWFGGFGMFWLLRRHNLTAFPAAFAAFAFVFNGVTLSSLQWGNYIASLAWLPWVVGLVMQSWRDGQRWVVAAAFASAMQVLTATPELTLLTWVFLGALWLAEIPSGQIKTSTSARHMCLAVLLASGMVMIQILPFFDLLAHSQRNTGNTQAVIWSMPAWGWANLLVPLFHCYQSPQGPWFQHGQDFISSYYLGAGVLALAVVGTLRTRSRFVVVIAATVLFCWIMALGPDGVLYNGVKRLVPLVGIARYPVKFTILTAFLLPILAAYGIESVCQSKNSQRPLVFIAGAFLLLMAGLVWFERQYPYPQDDWSAIARGAAAAALLLLGLAGGLLWLVRRNASGATACLPLMLLAFPALDALMHSPEIAPTLPSFVLAPGIWQAGGKPPPPALGEGRVMLTPDAERKLLYSFVGNIQSDFIGKRVAEWYNLNLLDGVPKVNGAITLRPAHFDVLERFLYYTPGGHCGRGLVDFLSVAWLLSAEDPPKWFARTQFLPVITAGQKPLFAGDDQALAAIIADDFSPRDVVYLPESARPAVTVSNKTVCSVSNPVFSLNSVRANVNAAAPSLVVLSQTYYHLWRASVDGQPVPLLRANLAFQAIQVPAGTHHIKLAYRDPWLALGAAISALSLVACVLIWRKDGRHTASRPLEAAQGRTHPPTPLELA